MHLNEKTHSDKNGNKKGKQKKLCVKLKLELLNLKFQALIYKSNKILHFFLNVILRYRKH